MCFSNLEFEFWTHFRVNNRLKTPLAERVVTGLHSRSKYSYSVTCTAPVQSPDWHSRVLVYSVRPKHSARTAVRSVRKTLCTALVTSVQNETHKCLKRKIRKHTIWKSSKSAISIMFRGGTFHSRGIFRSWDLAQTKAGTILSLYASYFLFILDIFRKVSSEKEISRFVARYGPDSQRTDL